jgi:dihydroorotase
MNPPIRTREHTDALWRAIADGTVDTLGSDHAPHTLDEKSVPYPKSPSGMPGVQTMLTVMLDHVHHGRLSLERLVDLLCHGSQRVYGIAGKGRIATGYDADFAIVDLAASQTISDRQMKSKCGWTPYDGMTVTGRVIGTMLRGRIAVWEDELILKKPSGQAVRFTDTLIPLGEVPEKNIPVCGATACC